MADKIYPTVKAGGSSPIDTPFRKKTVDLASSISAIILTYNEAANIRECLESVKRIVSELFIVDSGSTDNTIEIAQEYTANIFHHPFENYGKQRNWALNNLPIKTEWVLNLDADHRVSKELAKELKEIFSKPKNSKIDGFLTSRRSIFMGKWIRYGGHYPTYHCTLFKTGKGKCEEKLYDQHFLVEGKKIKLTGDIIDVMTESVSSFIERHNRWATLEAEDQYYKLSNNKEAIIKGCWKGDSIEKRRFVKSIYEKFPLFVRPFIYFAVRYLFKLGFLDGMRGLIFHFLQGFWFRFLVDVKIYELRKAHRHEGS